MQKSEMRERRWREEGERREGNAVMTLGFFYFQFYEKNTEKTEIVDLNKRNLANFSKPEIQQKWFLLYFFRGGCSFYKSNKNSI